MPDDNDDPTPSARGALEADLDRLDEEARLWRDLVGRLAGGDPAFAANENANIVVLSRRTRAAGPSASNPLAGKKKSPDEEPMG